MSRLLMVKKSNSAFYRTAVVSALMGPALLSAICQAKPKAPPHQFAHSGYMGSMLIDVSELRSDESFISDLARIAKRVADRIPDELAGHLNEKVLIDEGPYRFKFQVKEYWMENPYEPPPEDPKRFPTGLEPGRTVELKIGLAV